MAECYDPDEEHAASTALLDAAATRLQGAGIGPTITKEIEVGDPAGAILQVATLADTDLIVMGSRGLSAAQRFLLGSVSTKVATHAPCAVLVAHPKVAPAAVPAEEGREMVPA